jgi:hypothetical protein
MVGDQVADSQPNRIANDAAFVFDPVADQIDFVRL